MKSITPGFLAFAADSHDTLATRDSCRTLIFQPSSTPNAISTGETGRSGTQSLSPRRRSKEKSRGWQRRRNFRKTAGVGVIGW